MFVSCELASYQTGCSYSVQLQGRLWVRILTRQALNSQAPTQNSQLHLLPRVMCNKAVELASLADFWLIKLQRQRSTSRARLLINYLSTHSSCPHSQLRRRLPAVRHLRILHCSCGPWSQAIAVSVREQSSDCLHSYILPEIVDIGKRGMPVSTQSHTLCTSQGCTTHCPIITLTQSLAMSIHLYFT